MRRASVAEPSQADDSGIAMSPAVRGRQGSLSAAALPKDAVPRLLDIKKFVRKNAFLRLLAWNGRGGVGCWTIPDSEGAKDAKIVFTSITEALARQESLDQAMSAMQLAAGWPVVREAPVLRRERGVTASSYTSISTLDSFADSASSRTTPGGSSFKEGLAKLSNSPTSAKAAFEVPEAPVTPIARGFAIGDVRKARSKSASQAIDADQTPTRGCSGKSNSISVPSSTKKSEADFIKVIHGGGWVSRKTLKGASSGSIKANKGKKDTMIEEPPKKSDRQGGRGGRKGRNGSHVEIELPQPLTEQNLCAVPATSSMVEFPDLARSRSPQPKAETSKLTRAAKK